MKKITIAAALFFSLGLMFTSCNETKKEVKTEAKEQVEEVKKVEATEHEHSDEMAMATYQCPMKCEGDKTYAEDGTCPVCKMDLKKVEASNDAENANGSREENHDGHDHD